MDPILLEVLWNRLIGVVNEQAAALMRTSFTSVVREAGDISAGVFDRRGRMIAQAVTGTPGHINSMATSMHHFLAAFPLETLGPGDVLVTNDPWKTASQLNDITVMTPVFRGDRLIAFFGNTCHALDIGGRGLSADAGEVFEEGIQIPVMKLFERGRPNAPLLELVRANVRTPDEVVGDIHAQVVGNEIGGQQLLTFLAEFDLPDIERLADVIVERSEAAMRERIAALPGGAYTYELACDGFDEPVRIVATVTVRGGDLGIDYTGSSAQVRQGINVALNYTHAYTTYAVKCAISPDVPNNEGSFRPVTVTAPEGSILNARFPAAVAGRHLVGHFLPSAIFGALAQVLPDRVKAPGFDGLWDTQIFGHDPRRGAPFTYVWFSAGGTGALAGRDGLSATAFPSGIAGTPVEVIESLSPVVIRRRELRQDSGGPGRFRGGLGQVLEIAVRTDRPYLFSGLYERIASPAPGLLGGGAGRPGAVDTNNPAVEVRPKTRTLLPAGTEVTLSLPGGGGYGPASERDPALVLEDVRNGYVSAGRARIDYGVAVDLGRGAAVRPHSVRRGRAAVIDVGSNTIHVLVADVGGVDGVDAGESAGRRLSPVFDDSIRARLGLWVAEAGPLGPERIETVASIVRGFAAEARLLGVDDIIVLGTHAVRAARDRGPLLDAIGRAAGVAARVLTTAEEAEMCLAGAGLGPLPQPPFLFVDIGGGSSDLAAVAPAGIAATASLPIGSGVLAERDLTGDPPSGPQVERAATMLRGMLGEVTALGPAEFREIVVTGGAARRLRRHYGDRRAALTARELHDTVGRLLGTPSGRWTRSVTPERAALVRAGGMILQEIMTRWRVSLWRVSKFGLREGALVRWACGFRAGVAETFGTEGAGGHRDA